MELKKMPIKLFAKKFTRAADHRDEQEFENQVANNPRILAEYQFLQKIWQESENTQIFEQIDTNSDWKLIIERIHYTFPVNYRRIPMRLYFLRIAALLVLTFGLSFGLYRIIVSLNNTKTGFTTQTADCNIKDIILPDGSSVTLNTGSNLTYHEGFGSQSRDVILEGEALFNVMHNASLPFKVFIGESVLEVTGTSFSVREIDGDVKVSVLSGTVLLSSTDGIEKKITITANHSGYLLTNNELKVEDGIPANVLSWKTGHLVFDQTPIDSALMDIAHHFRKELSFETTLTEDITAEFQDQPLREILDELKLVAGLQFDTTGTALIVRK
jgi:transmembrane sensor